MHCVSGWGESGVLVVEVLPLYTGTRYKRLLP